MKKICFSITLVFVGAICFSSGLSAQSVTVDMGTEYQSIQGFGGMNHTSWVSDLSEATREKAFGNAPGNLGLSILRIHIDPDESRWSDQLATSQFAHDQGALIFATPWDPPSDMIETVNELKKLKTDMYSDYVNHLNSFNTFMSNNDVPLYAISVQNEPDYGDWTRWTSSEMVTFLKENAQNIENKVIAPESFQFRRDFTDPILNDDAASANVDIIGGHIYGGGLSDYPLARDKGKEVWMTEHYTSSDRSANLWPDALGVGKEINDCMEANFNAYVWWYIRRFYGLITDDGLLSKRGYVLSQYSKFVRPGNVRVEAEVTNASNVFATAFKTDTSLVIVVVNNNSNAVNLDFSIANGTVDTLTKFVTSATKSVVNDGGVSISGGSFSAVFDAYSITTLTTHTQSGPRFDNIAPVAVAGDDVNITDEDGTGFETISLDASASSDSDGELVDLVWSLDGDFLTSDTTYDVDLMIGDHVIVLTVIDNDGVPDHDTMLVHIEGIFETELYFEAECTTVGSTWEITEDETASNGFYVTTPAGTESTGEASADTADHVIVEFEVTEESNYKVWCRMITPSPNDDSFWIKMDDGTWTMWNSIPSTSDWAWDDVHDQSNDNPVTFYLTAGTHTLSICFREDGALLDKILIANSGVPPTGMGGDAETCLEDNGESSVELTNTESSVMVFPNPASESVNVISEREFNYLALYGIDGKVLIQKAYPYPVSEEQLNLSLESGIYYIKVDHENESSIFKLMIK
ncbi:MAG: T9SS type A sorting domain-containing protein [Bacteroidales bacterium]|nr:T9SS type A sorting domain-containing protein [Bacteroidales bacterium]MBN2819949.1 T9SS type A sorting domain-containing protein [Bacteroidales bacterium]